MMKFVLYSVVYLAACSLSFGVSDSLKMQIHRTDGKVVEEVVKLEKIGKDTFRLKISHKKFPRSGSSTPYSRVKYVDFIHDDASAKKGDAGYWVLAEGFFGKFTRDDGFYELRRNKIPIYGVKKGDEAFVAIVKGLRWEYSSCVKVADGKYTIFPRFHISQIGMPIYEDIVIDFTYFKGENADYSAMGRAYRDYQLSRGEVLPLKERIKGNPRLAYSVDSPFLKFRMASFMRECETGLNRGFHWDNNDAPNIQIHRNFDNMMDTLRKLKEMGIDKADIILTNWNWRSNGRNPIYGVAEPELGGNAKCRQLTHLAKELGYQIAPHILHTENYTVSPAFDEKDLALQQNGGYIHYDGMGGEGYCPCFKQVYYKQVLENYTNMQLLGFDSIMHIDVTSAIVPYQCFSLSHFCTRKQTAFYMNQIGKISRALFGEFTSESGVDSVANTMDYCLYVTATSDIRLRREFPLADSIVPLWQIVYHGIIMSNPYFQTIGYPCHEAEPNAGALARSDKTSVERKLKFVEFGGRLTFYAELNDDSVLPKLKEAYAEYQKLKHLQLEFIDRHCEIASGVFLTEYSDGSKTVVNYTDRPFVYKSDTVSPKSYKLISSLSAKIR